MSSIRKFIAEYFGKGALAAKAKAAVAQPTDGKQEPDAVGSSAKPQVEKKEVEILEDRRRKLKKARAAWAAVKIKAEADLEKVKEGARQAYMADADQFPKIVQGCKDIDAILDHLDDDLRDTLDQYVATPVKNQTKLLSLAGEAVEILDRYQQFVANSPLMKAIDEKEFADVTIYGPVMKALGDMKKALS
jgi:hypothetical protein